MCLAVVCVEAGFSQIQSHILQADKAMYVAITSNWLSSVLR